MTAALAAASPVRVSRRVRWRRPTWWLRHRPSRTPPGSRYLRVSSGPDEDAGSSSTDYESGLELPGLSVNPLTPEVWWTRPLREWLACQMCNYVHLAEEAPDRHAWVLAGEIVARGPDDEPMMH